MRYLLALGSLFLIFACSGSKSSHTVSVRKPIYHHTWYKKSRWHKKQIGPVRVHLHLFEKQGTRKVKMRG